MKKSVVTALGMVLLLFMAGCLDYKAYDIPKDQAGQADLVDEIAQVERELGLDKLNEAVKSNTSSTATAAPKENVVEVVDVVEEEVILPELTEEDVVDEACYEGYRKCINQSNNSNSEDACRRGKRYCEDSK